MVNKNKEENKMAEVVGTVDAEETKTGILTVLDTYITEEESKQASLYTQRDDLKTQVRALNEQINALNVQIAETESDDLKKARAKRRAVDMIDSGRGGPMLRQFGI